MFSKQSCQHCGTHIEFDADQIGNDGYTLFCPKCQAPVTLLRPPPISAPPLIKTIKRSRLWIWMLALGTIAFAMLLFLMVSAPNSPLVSALNVGPAYAIKPERELSSMVAANELEQHALDFGVKELNKLFYKSGDFLFGHFQFVPEDFNVQEFYPPQHYYVQARRVGYHFVSFKLSEADAMNR